MKAKVQILRCEGLNCDAKALGCYIMIDNELTDVITPLFPASSNQISSQSEDVKIEIPCEGQLKLIFKMMSGDPLYMGSASIDIELLPHKGYLWLPISQNIDSDTISSLTSSSSTSKVLVSICKPQPTIDNAQLYKLQIKKLEFIIKQLEEKIAEFSGFYEIEKEARGKLALGYENLKGQYEDYVCKAESRDLSMIRLLESKDKELQKQFVRGNDLENRFLTLNFEKEALVEMLAKVKSDKSEEIMKQQASEIAKLRNFINAYQEKEGKLMETVKSMGKEWTSAVKSRGFSLDSSRTEGENIDEICLKAQILELNEENYRLKEKIFKLANESEKLSSKVFEMEEIQCQSHSIIVEPKNPSLEKTLISLGASEIFSKGEDGYYFNNKKINLSVENGKIVVNSLPVENFLQLSFTATVDKSILSDNDLHSKTFIQEPKKINLNLTYDAGLENLNTSLVLEN